MLSAAVPASEAPTLPRLLDRLRSTDSVALHRARGGWELDLVADRDECDHAAIEARLVEECPAVACGWAEFPEGGYTLDALLENAREDRSRSAARSAA